MGNPEIEQWFPDILKDGYSVTSPSTPEYNCIAWAAGENTDPWDPSPILGRYWPTGIPRNKKLETFIQLYGGLGYAPCDDGQLEPGFEKIALYTAFKQAKMEFEVTHAARQTPSGRWTSKIGGAEDIEHKSLEGLCSMNYGTVAAFMKRRMKKKTTKNKAGRK